jgi:hypothetical protein
MGRCRDRKYLHDPTRKPGDRPETLWVARVGRCQTTWSEISALLAAGIDLSVIHYFGVSNYCLTAAYAFNLPAYAVLWLGGLWLHREMRGALSDALRLAGSAIAALSVCFAITNGSFYWLGGRVREASMAGWVENFSDWYLSYVITALLYVAIAAVAHVAVTSRTGVARPWRSN